MDNMLYALESVWNTISIKWVKFWKRVLGIEEREFIESIIGIFETAYNNELNDFSKVDIIQDILANNDMLAGYVLDIYAPQTMYVEELKKN